MIPNPRTSVDGDSKGIARPLVDLILRNASKWSTRVVKSFESRQLKMKSNRQNCELEYLQLSYSCSKLYLLLFILFQISNS